MDKEEWMSWPLERHGCLRQINHCLRYTLNDDYENATDTARRDTVTLTGQQTNGLLKDIEY